MRLHSVVEITRPEVEPVSLSAAKGQLGLLPEQEDDHDLILRLIGAARRLVEQRLGISLAARRFRATFVPGGPCEVRLPSPPLLVDGSHPLEVSVGGVVVSSGTYAIDADSRPAVLRSSAWPSVTEEAPLVVTFWAGPPPGEPIEPGLESAILLYVGHGYRNREATTGDGTLRELPMGFETLLAAHSVTGAW